MEILTDILACAQHIDLTVFPSAKKHPCSGLNIPRKHVHSCSVIEFQLAVSIITVSSMFVKIVSVHKILVSSCIILWKFYHRRKPSPACLAKESYELLFLLITASQNSEDVGGL